MKRLVPIGLAILLIFTATPALAKDLVQNETAGPYRLKLELLPPEQFYTAKQVSTDEAKAGGMLILGGAEPVQPDASSHPDHHLIVHVYDKATHQPLQDAKVQLTLQRLNSEGQPIGKAEAVPVVKMQAIASKDGKDAGIVRSTHYGNNVTLAPGDYRIVADANGHKATFTIDVS
ncbi:MAG TPA: hypothetical protein VMF50_11635 [Candidatus Binataceae bacterium]|nr:hypothetical protein [Candidatus Binataceae bacterium]